MKRSSPHSSFRLKLLLHALITAAVALGIVFLVSGTLEVWDTRDALVRDSSVLSQIIGANAAAALVFGDAAFARQVLTTLKNEKRVVTACLYDEHGAVFAHYARDPTAVACPPKNASGHRFVGSRLRVFRDVTYDRQIVGTLLLESSLAALYATLMRSVAFAAFASLLGLLLAALVAENLQRSLMRPVGELARVARQVKEHRDYAARAVQYSQDELGHLTEAFNEMLEYIESTEAALRQQQKLEAIGTLASGVAHEINNPLTYILGNLEWLQFQLKDLTVSLPPERREEIERAATQAVDGSIRVRDIVTGLNAFSRRQDDVALSPVDVGAAADAAIRLAENEIRHAARLVKDYAGVPAVDGHAGRLTQVFLNLIINALHAMAKGERQRNRLEIRIRLLDGHVVASISDTGTGITPEALERVFDPFFTTKDVGKGTGLGLFLCRDMVLAMGGRIAVDTELGQGTTFSVWLPPSQTVEQEARRTETQPAARHITGLRILVIDDEQAILDFLQRALSEHDVSVTTRGAEAIRRCQTEPFDVILCDLMMPEVSGANVYEKLGELETGLQQRMIFITGGAFTDEARAFLDSHPNSVVAKPIDAAKLRSAIEDVVSQGA